MKYEVVLSKDYLLNKSRYIEDIKFLYQNDTNKLANIEDITRYGREKIRERKRLESAGQRA